MFFLFSHALPHLHPGALNLNCETWSRAYKPYLLAFSSQKAFNLSICTRANARSPGLSLLSRPFNKNHSRTKEAQIALWCAPGTAFRCDFRARSQQKGASAGEKTSFSHSLPSTFIWPYFHSIWTPLWQQWVHSHCPVRRGGRVWFPFPPPAK